MNNSHLVRFIIPVLILTLLISCSNDANDAFGRYEYESIQIEDYAFYLIDEFEGTKDYEMEESRKDLITNTIQSEFEEFLEYENNFLSLTTIEYENFSEVTLIINDNGIINTTTLDYNAGFNLASTQNGAIVIDFEDDLAKIYFLAHIAFPTNVPLTFSPQYGLTFEMALFTNAVAHYGDLKEEYEYKENDTLAIYLPVMQYRKVN